MTNEPTSRINLSRADKEGGDTCQADEALACLVGFVFPLWIVIF